ncbi:unnamed protein product [Acanthoscelides obtectus]|uniref:Uncharacterized protein n=1 Tax=Acanthoscelides obtectus TaxID=200917 RepID=A0A9P0Q8K1_ACAOB|nr:unnamed protein product [Acanthoscelides obtectus]CAK1689541.1 hypothetical protein AOBTE_LOCUS37333 [Acanthoscelides obtectus]
MSQAKSKRRKSNEESSVSRQTGVNTDAVFMQLDIRQFCPKGIYDIVFIQPVNKESDDTLKNIVETAREYEDTSSLTFITAEEILDLVENYALEAFPSSLSHIPEIVYNAAAKSIGNGAPLHPSLQAQLVKLKLIQVMHKQYLKELDKLNKRKALEDELSGLTKEMRKGKKEKGGPGTKSGASSKAKDRDSKGNQDEKGSKGSKVEGLYTTISENDIIFDDNIFNHVWYYVIQGVTNPDIVLYLNKKYRVATSAVLKFGIGSIHASGQLYEGFWKKMNSFFYGPHREDSFENTILMKHVTEESDGKAILEEILYVIKKISDLKLNHLNYIRHVKLHEQRHRYRILPMHCFQRYNAMLKRIPYDLVTEPVILNCILDEIQYQNEHNLLEDDSTEELLKPRIDVEIECHNPCDNKEILKRHKTAPRVEMPKQLFKSFYSYEGDMIDIIANTYRKRGRVVVQILDDILRKSEPMRLVSNYENDCSDIPHRHDVNPAAKHSLKNPEGYMHFMYLLLFSLFKSDSPEASFEDTVLTEILQTFTKSDYWKTSQIEIVVDSEGEESNCDVNLFDPIRMQYIWRERLPSSCLIRSVYNAMNEFTYMHKTFCEETDVLLVRFTDHLDQFGVNIKVYQVHIRTPVCFRDFCRYVTVEEADWLQSNKPPRYVRPNEVQEICQGKKAIIKKDIFKEYRHLLDTNIQLESEPDEIEVERKPSVSFQETLEELQTYPTNKGLIEQCNKVGPQFLAYPMDTNHFRLRGNRTTFVSHDGFKIVVDNTSILTEDPKCTVTLTCRDNQLVLHSSNIYSKKDYKNYTFHWNLSDGTIVMFVLNPPKPKRKLVPDTPEIRLQSGLPEIFQEESEKRNSSIRNSDASDRRESFLAEQERGSLLGGSAKMSSMPKILAVDKDWFAKVVTNEEDVTVQTAEPEDIASKLQDALDNERQVYKIQNKLNYLKRKCSKTEIPITSIFNQILHKRIKRFYGNELFARRFDYSDAEGKSLEVNSSVDFRITLPNGLYITCYPSQIREDLCEVKQEYLEKGVDQSGIMHEEFRLFARGGFVLIKKVDGSITILKSNGDTVEYDKPDGEIEDVVKSNLRKCHCKTVADYRKKLAMILKGTTNQGECYISRRAYMRTKKGYVISDEVANMLKNSKIPYLKSSSIKFDGKYICLQKNKITEKQLFYTTQQKDCFTDEVFYERTDGFEAMFDKTGRLQVKYADKTKITSSVHVSKDLYDGYVYVSLDFKFEHPQYATVSYNANNNVDIRLNNDVVLTKNPTDSLSLSIGEDIATAMDNKKVKFTKRCVRCMAESNANFNISPFFTNKLKFSDEFLRAEDSYNKMFYATFSGSCKRNASFISGPFNCNKCNHYVNNNYEKLFVINRNYVGDCLWNENMIRLRDEESKKNCVIKDLLDLTGDRGRKLKYETNHCNSIDRRFLNNKLLDEQFCLTKYKGDAEEVSPVCYTTVTELQQMLDPIEVDLLLKEILNSCTGCELAGLSDVAKYELTQVSYYFHTTQ